MSLVPINKYLANDYRLNLGTNDAPNMIDTEREVLAVVEIQKGLPKPNSKQILHYTYVAFGAASQVGQIASVSATSKIYFIGCQVIQNAAVVASMALFDATSGNGPSTSANTLYNDNLGYLFAVNMPATIGQNLSLFPPMPIEVKGGLRITGGAAGSNLQIITYWLEELQS